MSGVVEAWISGAIIGVIVAILISTFFIAISLRQRAFTFYLIYLFGFFLYVIAFSGTGDSFFWAGSVWAAKRALPFSQTIMAFGISLFAKHYLAPRRRWAPIPFALSIAATAASAEVIALAVLDARLAALIGTVVENAVRLLVLAAAVQAAATGG